VTGSPPYRGLLDRADGDIARAAVELATAPLNGRRAALEAVAAYRALLGDIHAHVKAVIIHDDRMADLAASSPGDSCDAAAAQIIRGLIRLAYLPGLIRYAAEGPATAWGAAKTSLDAATDLLITYRNLDSVIRALQLTRPRMQRHCIGRHRRSHVHGAGSRTGTRTAGSRIWDDPRGPRQAPARPKPTATQPAYPHRP
jgi:hypothetical protein